MGSAAVASEKAQASAIGEQRASRVLNNDSRYGVNMLFSCGGGKIKDELQHTKFLSSWETE